MAQFARSFPIDRDCVNTNSTSGIFKSVSINVNRESFPYMM